jgi:hypothetical protein
MLILFGLTMNDYLMRAMGTFGQQDSEISIRRLAD